MKKVLSVMLATMMIASLFAVNAGAMVIDETYTVVEGAHDEIVYLEQDYSDAEKTDFTTANYAGKFTVDEDGVLHAKTPSAESQFADMYSTATIGSGEYVLEFDYMRNDDLKADFGMKIIFNRAANAAAENTALQRYGIFIPVRTVGMYEDENGVRYEDAVNPAQDIEAHKWYTFRITVSESAFVAAGGDGGNKYHLIKLIKAERKEKDGTEWTELPYTTSGNNFPANTSRAYGNNITTDKVANAKEGSEIILSTEACPNAQGLKATGYVKNEETGEYVADGAITYVEDGTLIETLYDNIKIYTPENKGTEVVKNYPFVKGTSNVIVKDETTITGYAGGNANPREYIFTTKLDSLTQEGQTRQMEYTFDAINTVKGMPICIHLGAANAGYGFDVLSTDEILGKWYTYKVVFTETFGSNTVGLETISRKAADSDVWEVYRVNFASKLPSDQWSTAPVAGWWNNYDITSAKFHVRGTPSGTGATNRVRIVWRAGAAELADPTIKDLSATVWKFRNQQVVTGAYAAGEAKVEDGVLNVDAKLKAASSEVAPVLAVYDESGRMIDADFTALAGGMGDVNLSADYADGNTAKIFFWKNFEDGRALFVEPWDITADIAK